MGLARHAIPLQEAVRDFCLQRLGLDNTNTLAAMQSLASSYYDAGRRNEALTLREELLPLSRRINGPEGPETLGAMQNLASSYLEAGRSTEAIQLQDEVMSLSRKVYGPEDRRTLRAMEARAASYHQAGQHTEAIDLLQKVLSSNRKVGPEHPATLSAMQALARSYYEADRFAEALKLQEEVLPLSRKVNGPEHPITLAAMERLAASYYDAGRTTENLKLREELLSLSRKANGPEHPDTFRALLNLAIFSQKDEAIKQLEEGLSLARKTLKPDHPLLVLMMRALADCYVNAARTEEALLLLGEASSHPTAEPVVLIKLAALQVWLGRDTDYEATCRRMYAWAADTQKPGLADAVAKTLSLRPSTNSELVEAALKLGRRATQLGRTNRLFAWFQLAQGMAEYRSGNYVAAGEVLDQASREALNMARALSPGWRHLIQGTAGFYRAMSLFRQGNPDEALKAFTEAETRMPPLPSDERNPLANDGNHDVLIFWLAYKEAKALLNAPSQPNQAITYHEYVLEHYRKTLGPENSVTLSAMIALADSYRAAGRTNDAVTLGRSSLELFRKTLGETDGDTLNAMTELAISYRVAGNPTEAISLETESLRLKRQHLPRSNPMVLESIDNLATCYEESNQKSLAEPLRRELAELKAKAESRKRTAGQSPTEPRVQ